MTIQNPDGRSLPGNATGEGQSDENACDADTGITPVGLLCDNILSAISLTPALSETAKLSIGTQIGNILMLFHERDERERLSKRKISELKSNLRIAREKIAVLRQELFDKSSERAAADDGKGDEEKLDLEFALDDDEDVADPKEASKGKRARKMPMGIVPLVVHHYPESRTCNCCGNEMPLIGSWDSMQMRIVPEHVEFINNIYHKCACNRTDRCKENKPMSAKTQNHIMYKRAIEPTFAAEVAVQKFGEHIPTFRMERRLRSANINITRQTLNSSVAHLGGHFQPVCDELLSHVKAGQVVHADETPLRVQAPGKGKCDTGYIWAVCRDERNWNPEAKPAVVYEYDPSRAGAVIERLLGESSIRVLISDGYAGYNRLFGKDGSNEDMVSARCWAHARRTFFEAWTATKSPLANWVIKKIRKLYDVEQVARGLPPEEREKLRQEQSLPVLTEIRVELDKNAASAQGLLKKAIDYTLKAFEALQRFIFDGRIEIDNNAIERCIRGIALTKKNSLFAGNHKAAKVWAIYYSLIETARLNMVNPRAYLKWITEEIERNRGNVDYSTLMPWHCPIGRIED